nr:immunoglobulin light chain junction region [Macaca mulatta]MOW62568.1 immunoglobulin light chain junction region [Macaca mulatta]MOW65231.1 immunoglobulin light chain junction region [Macaca mulatta]
CQKYSSSPYTF